MPVLVIQVRPTERDGIELTFRSSSDLSRTRPQSVKVIVEFEVIETAHASVCRQEFIDSVRISTSDTLSAAPKPRHPAVKSREVV